MITFITAHAVGTMMFLVAGFIIYVTVLSIKEN